MKTLTSAPKAPEETKPSAPPQIDIGKIVISNGTLKNVKNYAGGRSDFASVTNFNLELTNIGNGKTAKMTLKAGVIMDNQPPAPAASGSLEGNLQGSGNFALSALLKPASVKVDLKFTASNASGNLAEMSGFVADLNADVNPTEIHQVTLQFQRGDANLGQVLVSGPFNLDTMEGKLTAEVRSIDKQLLNLAGAGSGMEFGNTSINSTNTIELAKAGSLVTVAGGLDVSQLQITSAGQSTPLVNASAKYNLELNSNDKTAQLRALNVSATHNSNPLLNVALTSPMSVSWSGASPNSSGDAGLTATLSNFNLADWKMFLGDIAPAGIVNGKLDLKSQNGGKLIALNATSQIDNLTADLGGNQLTQASIELKLAGEARDLKEFELTTLQLQLKRDGQQLLTVSGSGSCTPAGQTADLQIAVQAALDKLFAALPGVGVSASSGSLELQVHVAQKQLAQTVTGQFALKDFSANLSGTALRNFGVSANLDVAKDGDAVQIHKIAGALTQDGKTGGNFDVSGAFNLADQSCKLKAALNDFNATGLRPFVEPMLTGKKLASIAINGDSSVQYDPKGSSAVQANLVVTNLVVNDPQHQFPATPLEAKLSVDAAMQGSKADVHQLQVTLTPTARANNELTFSGQVDFSHTNAIQGALKLTADSLDVTHYYELFSGTSQTQTASTTKPTQSPTPAATPKEEPAPVILPLHDFTIGAKIGALYLADVAVTNFETNVKLDGGRVLLEPFQFSLNGAPVKAKADLDLSVPGYKYALNFSAGQVPMAPLVDTFVPERKGQMSGTLTANAEVSGLGITDASLQKNLAGQFDIGTTNLNLSVLNIKSRLLKVVINVVATLPELYAVQTRPHYHC